MESLEEIHRNLAASGRKPRTAEEIDAEVNALREDWEERRKQIEHLQDDCRRAREKPAC